MVDRLSELIRQRQLIQQHLAWLDMEITLLERGAKSKIASETSTLPPDLPTPYPIPPVPHALNDAVAERILAEHGEPRSELASNVKRGCLLYFMGAILLIFGIITVTYLFYIRRITDFGREIDPPAEVTPR